MDPNATLERIGELIDELSPESSSLDLRVSELLILVEALDGWLSKGGFLPAAWRHDR